MLHSYNICRIRRTHMANSHAQWGSMFWKIMCRQYAANVCPHLQGMLLPQDFQVTRRPNLVTRLPTLLKNVNFTRIAKLGPWVLKCLQTWNESFSATRFARLTEFCLQGSAVAPCNSLEWQNCHCWTAEPLLQFCVLTKDTKLQPLEFTVVEFHLKGRAIPTFLEAGNWHCNISKYFDQSFRHTCFKSHVPTSFTKPVQVRGQSLAWVNFQHQNTKSPSSIWPKSELKMLFASRLSKTNLALWESGACDLHTRSFKRHSPQTETLCSGLKTHWATQSVSVGHGTTYLPIVQASWFELDRSVAKSI